MAVTKPLLFGLAVGTSTNASTPIAQSTVDALALPTKQRAAADSIREPEFAAFEQWLHHYQQSDETTKKTLEAEGIVLAQQRLTALADLIQTQPERALELAMPFAEREAVPRSIRAHLEEQVNARGDLAVIAAVSDAPSSLVPPVMRTATIEGQDYQTFTYGKGLRFLTKQDVPLNGIAVPNDVAKKPYSTIFGKKSKLLALAESPARILDRDEVAALDRTRAKASEPEPICSVSQKPVNWQNEETVIELGGNLHSFCGKVDASWWANANIQAAGLEIPGGAKDLPTAQSTYTEGRKRMFCMRPYWSDYAPVLSTNEAITRYVAFSNYMFQLSYGKLMLAPLGRGSEISPDLLLPGLVADYDNTGLGKLYTTSRDVARTNYGYDLTQYDFLYVMTGSKPAAGYCGLAYVGAVGFHIPCWGADVTAHEFGHNLGLNHAHFWDTDQKNIIGSGQNVEYGDNNDPMGGGGDPNQYNSRYKNYLGWITNTDVVTIPSSGINRYRLYCFDLDYSVGLRGLKFTHSGSDNYWINFRQRKTTKAALMNGAQLLWTGNGNEGSYLLDVRLKGDADNNAIVIGRTFSDTNLNFHFTPIGKGNTYPESIDIITATGSQPGNLPPTAFLTASTLTPNVGQAVSFNAVASDPNNDTLAYYWEFGDGVDSYSFDNKPSQSHGFTTIGEYAVRCVVSDMRGGVAQHSLIVRVGSPSVFRISGHVMDLSGRPLVGALVSSGGKSVFADSDGSYTIPGLTAGNYNMSAIEPVRGAIELVHPFFANPVTIGPNAQNIDFVVGTSAPPSTLVATGAMWRYFDKGTDPGTGWQLPGFSDGTWSNGPSQFGYGEGDESTVLNYGGVATSKFPAYYFRRTFDVTTPAALTNVVLNVLRDDGAIVYLNGTEIFRNNMPAGTPTYTTLAAANATDDGQTWFSTNVSTALFVAGQNTLAAEVHQDAITSSDITFDLTLTTESVANIQRGAVVYVSNPADNAVFNSPTNITVSAGANSTPIPVVSVEIYDGATQLGVFASPPYSAALNAPADGLHVLRAVSVDGGGLRRTSAPVNITVMAPVPQPAAITFVQTGSVWRYFCASVGAAAGWQNAEFDDSLWTSGAARLGFNTGNTGFSTVINGGPSTARYPTAYFRTPFVVNDPASVTNLAITLARDDGAIVYLNGVEIMRDNITTGVAPTYSLLASNAADNGGTYYSVSVPAASLTPGTNVLAVEVHQSSATSSDLVFDAGLSGLLLTNRARGCWFVSPASGSTIPSPGNATLTAEVVAGGNLGVTRVEFYSDDVLIGQDSSSPFSFAWNSPPSGLHSLVAIAYDSTGASITSAPVSVTVAKAPYGDALISFGDVWKYEDEGLNLGTAWTASAYNDNQWMMGPGRLGYGGDGEITAVSYGTNANFKRITTYFRKKFVVPGGPASLNGLLLRLVRDDGAVVYMNGTEIYRNNLPPGPVSYNSLAQTAIGGADETTPIDVLLGTTNLLVGTNTIAVEMHQDSITSSDLGFDLALIGLHSTNDGFYMTSPAIGAHYNTPATVSLAAYAAGFLGPVSLVEYYDDTTKVGQAIVSPYSATLSGVLSGIHVLTAVATLNGGQAMTSAPVSIVVSPAPAAIAPLYRQIILSGSSWKYWDNAAPVSNGWKEVGFDDSSWPSGLGRFGWGLDGESTLLTTGRVTHYFRRMFTFSNGSQLNSLTFNVLRDDGVVVYLNGAEVFRTNMPSGPINGSTLAVATINTPDETIPVIYTFSTSGSGLLHGTNVVAVELHQSSATSSDAGFDLSLYGEGTSEARVYVGSPANGSTHVTGQPINFTAHAQGASGRAITSVEFYSDGTNFAQASTVPYRVTWSSAPTGTHTIIARATDDLGNSITSAPVLINVGYPLTSLVLIPSNSVWKYLDNGSNQGTNWSQPAFDDYGWASGSARLGYGGDGEETTISYGPNASAKWITSYFRRAFVVPPDTFITNLTFRLVRDDGAVLWLNGREAYRSNMPTGPITSSTLASTTVDTVNEQTFFVTTLGTTNVLPGTNIIGVEVHQVLANSSDVGFNLELDGDGYVLGNSGAPVLTATVTDGAIQLSWPASATDYQLYSSTEIGAAASWQLISSSLIPTNGLNILTIPTTNTTSFYRLQKP